MRENRSHGSVGEPVGKHRLSPDSKRGSNGDRHDIALPTGLAEAELERVVEPIAEVVFAKELPET